MALGQTVTVEQLEADPHPVLARLRAAEPVAWVPALGGWLVTGYDLALEVMRDARRFTVDDPRFSTAQVIGPSMLSLDGAEHDRHRAPFVAPFRPGPVRERFSKLITERAGELIDGFAGAAELRREFAGPLAASTMAHALGLSAGEGPTLLSWYERIVAAVTEITAGAGSGSGGGSGSGSGSGAGSGSGEDGPAEAGEDGRAAFALLRDRLTGELEAFAGPALEGEQLVSDAAVLLFGGIETTEGMIANGALALLTHDGVLESVRGDPALLERVIDESLRLEPAAAVVDRYGTADTVLGGASISAGELVRVSIAGANRDPAVFEDPDRFDLGRSGARRHLAFAQGPHVCVGVHLARLETRLALETLLGRLPSLRLDPARPAPRATGLVFRKPATLAVVW